MKADVIVRIPEMSNTVLFNLRNDRAKRWMRRHAQTEKWQWSEKGVLVNQSFVEEIARHMTECGLHIRITKVREEGTKAK